MTLDQAFAYLGKTVVLEWDNPQRERESAVAFLTRIDGSYLISDEGFSFLFEKMTAREAVRGVDY